MTPEKIMQKREMIDRLTLRECEGWREAIFEHGYRKPFHGEKDALDARERKLGGRAR